MDSLGVQDKRYIKALETLFGTGHLSQDSSLYPLLDGVDLAGRAIDFGCGLAGMSLKLLAAGCTSVLAVDKTGTLLDSARERIAKAGASDDISVLELADVLPLRKGSADIILVKDVLYYVKDLAWTCELLASALSSSGTLVVAAQGVARIPWSESYQHYMLHESTFMPVFPRKIAELRSALESAGLQVTVRDSTARTRRITEQELNRLPSMVDIPSDIRAEFVENWSRMLAAYDSNELVSAYLNATLER